MGMAVIKPINSKTLQTVPLVVTNFGAGQTVKSTLPGHTSRGGQGRVHEMDSTDVEILKLLQDNARLTFSEIGRRVHLSQPAVAERVRMLEESGTILGYHARVDATRLGYPILAIIHIGSATVMESVQVLDALKRFEEVIEIHSITGRDGFIVKVITPSIVRLNEIIRGIGEAAPPTTSIVLQTSMWRRTIGPAP